MTCRQPIERLTRLLPGGRALRFQAQLLIVVLIAAFGTQSMLFPKMTPVWLAAVPHETEGTEEPIETSSLAKLALSWRARAGGGNAARSYRLVQIPPSQAGLSAADRNVRVGALSPQSATNGPSCPLRC